MRLVDADKLRYKHSLNTVNTTMPQSFPCITKDEINNAPTIEAIPKDQYEARLKADLEAILVELQLKIEENGIVDFEETYVDDGECIISVSECTRLIQQKINELF